MSLKKKSLNNNNEVDLLEFFLNIWDQKLKIILFIIAGVLIGLTHLHFKTKEISYTITTKIKPITVFEESKYEDYNTYVNLKNKENEFIDYNSDNKIRDNVNITIFSKKEFELIEAEYLLDLFVSKLQEKTLFKNEIKKSNLIDKEKYENNQKYEKALDKKVASIDIFLPYSNDDKNKNDWRIKFKTKNPSKWVDILENIEKPVNNEIKIYLKNKFEKFIENQKQLIKYKIEDIEMKIDTAYSNYQKNILTRLAYLEEQSQIARKLNVAENRFIEAQLFTRDNDKVIATLSDIPYYMRGYKMIEKEMELIKNRTNIENFMLELPSLENEKKVLTLNKDLIRLKNLFNETPIMKSENFMAAKIMIQPEIINSKTINKFFHLIIAALISALLGIFYVLVIFAQKNRRYFTKK